MAKQKMPGQSPPRSPRFRTSCKRIAPGCCAPERTQMNRWHRQANRQFCRDWSGE